MTTRRERLLGWASDQSDDVGRLIKHAVDVADRSHTGQYRYSGEPFIEHALAAALILTEHDADPTTVAAAVLRYTTTAPRPEPIENLRLTFGNTIADLITEIRAHTVHYSHSDVQGADPRALRIKVATRLNNMRTVGACSDTSQRRQADSTRDLVVPLARQLGMDTAAAELDDLATATLTALEPGMTPVPLGLPVQAHLRALRFAALLLPAGHRERWLVDWHGELHSLPTRRARLTFVLGVLGGLPTMAVLTRRTEHR